MFNRKLLIYLVIVAILTTPYFALSLDYCFEDAGRQHGISPAVLWAISKVESRFNPYAINYNRNGTYDYCHMQINSSWAATIGENTWASLVDPCQCTKVGAWILSQCIKNNGYTWKAVGCYHAKSEEKRVGYSWKIYKAMKK